MKQILVMMAVVVLVGCSKGARGVNRLITAAEAEAQVTPAPTPVSPGKLRASGELQAALKKVFSEKGKSVPEIVTDLLNTKRDDGSVPMDEEAADALRKAIQDFEKSLPAGKKLAGMKPQECADALVEFFTKDEEFIKMMLREGAGQPATAGRPRVSTGNQIAEALGQGESFRKAVEGVGLENSKKLLKGEDAIGRGASFEFGALFDPVKAAKAKKAAEEKAAKEAAD